MKKVLLLAFAFVLSFSMQAASVVDANQPNIVQPSSKPFGLSYEEHVKNFWKLILSIPSSENPWEDNTGEKCASSNELGSKNSSIFYLASNGGGNSVRSCIVPEGKSLFIPISAAEASDKEIPGATVDVLRETVKGDQDDNSLIKLTFTIDGKNYKKESLQAYRTPTTDFVVDFANNGIFGVKQGGPSKVVADGYYIITEPVPKGNHTIQFQSVILCPGGDCNAPQFVSDITYKLLVG